MASSQARRRQKRKQEKNHRFSPDTKSNEPQKSHTNVAVAPQTWAIIVVLISIGWVYPIFQKPMNTTAPSMHEKGDSRNSDIFLDYEDGKHQSKEDARSSESHTTRNETIQPCGLYLAESTIPDSGVGVFAGVSFPKGTPVGPPDIVVHLVDVPPPSEPSAEGLRVFMEDYLWDGEETGGQYEGKTVLSALPGIGFLANGHDAVHNVLPYKPDVDDAGLTRTKEPGAGAISHYHNYSFYTQKVIHVGNEIFVNYGTRWFEERAMKGKLGTEKKEKVDDISLPQPIGHRSHAWLQENGLCMDNLQPGRSKIKGAGRGAFASRFIPKGSVIAPSPLVQITNRESLITLRWKVKEGAPDLLVEGKQLLLNYCYGHSYSSLLFYPTGSDVNFINHNSKNPNAMIRWSTMKGSANRGKDWLSGNGISIEELKEKNHAGLMFEYVATRDILPGEEVLINYGPRWEKAWQKHVDAWKPPPFAKKYTPSYVMNDVEIIRTEMEQRSHPYDANLITSCFYRYGDNRKEDDYRNSPDAIASKKDVVIFRWRKAKGMYDSSNLRPCIIISRKMDENGQSWYIALMKNRPGLKEEERIPRNRKHMVSHIPRQAIQFSDKLYTTDQHLENSFRHEIEIPDNIFPRAWMDLE